MYFSQKLYLIYLYNIDKRFIVFLNMTIIWTFLEPILLNHAVLRIPKILAYWIRIRVGKYQLNTEKKNFFTLNPYMNCWKKRHYKSFLISEWFIKFKHKNKQTKETKYFVISALLKIKKLWSWSRSLFPMRIQDPNLH